MPTLTPKEDYAKHYLTSAHWKDFTERFCALPANQCCAVCYTTEHLDINHLTYERRGAERLTDAVRMCHGDHWALGLSRPPERTWLVCLSGSFPPDSGGNAP